MALSRKTQKDVGKYQAKLVGPFTVRQSIFVGIAAVISMILWNMSDMFQMSMDSKIMTILVVAAPVALLGFLNPYGMTCLEFIKQYYEYHILSSKKRIYQTITDDEKIIAQQEKQSQSSTKNKKNKSQQKKEAAPVHKKDKDFPEYN
ncbi:MAG: PrgI family protein [Mobilitalea sp.]